MRVVFSVIVAALLFISETAAAGTLDRVRAAGVFKIGYRTDAPPFSYNSPIGEPAGYIVDLCREVAAAAKQELGLKDLKVDYVTVTAEDRFDAVKSGRIDLLCEATSVTLARRRLVDFSLMTFIDGASVMVRSDGPQSGELAAYFADRAILTFLLLGEGAPKTLRISKEYFTREPYALALARGDDDFRFLVDRTLARLYRGGAIGAIFARSFGKAKASEILQALYAINALPE